MSAAIFLFGVAVGMALGSATLASIVLFLNGRNL